MAAGIETRHARACRSRSGGRCSCEPTFRARVWSQSDGKRIMRTFANRTEAETWYHDAKVAVRQLSLIHI